MVPGRGLAALPAPSPGDLFFDIEGDPFAFEDGLEYLFGVADYANGEADYRGCWALDREQEKARSSSSSTSLIERREADPDLHIYHYGAYEPAACKRLMGPHATREEEVDELLRGGVFVDLLRSCGRAFARRVESYSIKNLEPLYGFEREVELREAGQHRSSSSDASRTAGPRTRSSTDRRRTTATTASSTCDCATGSKGGAPSRGPWAARSAAKGGRRSARVGGRGAATPVISRELAGS